MGARLTFDEAKHEYRYDGRVVPSVTQILGRVYPDAYAGIPAAVLDRKARLGTAVHKAIELALEGRLEESTLHEEVRPYVTSWRKWWERESIETIQLEEQAYHPLGYAMTRDFLGNRRGKRLLIDWKTTNDPMLLHDVQVTGYWMLDEPDEAGCLYLNKDGEEANFIQVNCARHLPTWIATLRVHNLMERMK